MLRTALLLCCAAITLAAVEPSLDTFGNALREEAAWRKAASQGDSKHRLQTLRTLASAQEPAAVALALRIAKEQGDATSTSTVLQALAQNPAATPSLPLIRSALADSQPQVLAAALHAVRSLGDDAMLPECIEALSSRDASVRSAALEALQGLSNRQYGEDPAAWRSWHAELTARQEAQMPVIVSGLASDNPQTVVENMHRLLMQTQQRSVTAELLSGLLEHPDARVRELARTGLGNLGTPQAAWFLTQVTDQPRETGLASSEGVTTNGRGSTIAMLSVEGPQPTGGSPYLAIGLALCIPAAALLWIMRQKKAAGLEKVTLSPRAKAVSAKPTRITFTR